MDDNAKSAKGFEYRKFATPRIIGGVGIVVIVLWALTIIFGSPEKPASRQPLQASADQGEAMQASPSAGHDTIPPEPGQQPAGGAHSAGAASGSGTAGMNDSGPGASHAPAARGTGTRTHGPSGSTASNASHAAGNARQHGQPEKPAAPQPAAASGHESPSAAAHDSAAAPPAQHDVDTRSLPATAVIAPVHKPVPKGVTFVEAAIKPLNYELEERWWGWRPNDIINVTDNINNYQMGVLEVTRRTTVALAERISRTGTTDAFDENLEQAMNWFMVKATSYWFPSAESKYREGLKDLGAYLEKLKEGKATFYIRADNLIPLLASFEDLLGSCDENLVKQAHEDGSEISFFSVDDYFYYTQGVASAMATVLEAVHHDFLLTLESRNATELLHHAIVACDRAAGIQPWIILDRNLSSILANHRANMAAPVSHARFYLGQLIKTLST